MIMSNNLRQQIRDVMGREWWAMWRRPWPTILLFLTPLVFCVLFGAVYLQNTVQHIPMAVYDEDQSSLSRKLIQVYNDSTRYDIVAYPSTTEELNKLLADGTVQVAVEIPIDFSKNIKGGQSTEVAVTVNSANNIIANSALASFEEDNRTFNVSVAQQLLEAYGVKPDEAMNAAYPVRLGTRIMHNPVTGYTDFMLPGIVLNGLQIALLLTVAPFLASILRRKLYGPQYSVYTLMFAKGTPYWIVSMVTFVLSIWSLELLWDVPMDGSWVQLLILGGAYIFAVMGVLFIVSVISPSEVMAVQLPLLYIMPGLLYSGLSWPIPSMAGFGKAYAYTMPMTYAMDTIRDIMLDGYAPTLLTDICILLAFGIGSCFFAGIIFDWRRRRMWNKRDREQEGGVCL